MRCSSSVVPSVTTAKLCVSPLVKMADPCARGKAPTSQVIGRISAGPRPSARDRFSKIIFRTSVYSNWWNTILICRSLDGSSGFFSLSIASDRIWSNRSCRAVLLAIMMASRIGCATNVLIPACTGASIDSAITSRFTRPTFLANSSIFWTIFLISAWANSSASSIVCSDNSLAPASTIITASAVPATTRCSSLRSIVSRSGLTTSWPLTRPIFTPATGPLKGMFDTARAADAAVIPITSEEPVLSAERTEAMTCVS